MLQYDITMEHNEDSLIALSHMQYDLFCTRNFIARNLLSLVAIAVGAMYFSRFWGIALVAYGAYLMTSTYSASNHTAKKLTEAIKASGKGFPSSRYCFTDKGIEITFHPGKPDEEKLTPVGYGEILKLGEDLNFFYLFPTPNGDPGLAPGAQQRAGAPLKRKEHPAFWRGVAYYVHVPEN